jgi:hypothetical protein
MKFLPLINAIITIMIKMILLIDYKSVSNGISIFYNNYYGIF